MPTTDTPAQTFTVTHVPFAKVPQFSNRDVAYVEGDERLRPFYTHPADYARFGEVFAQRLEQQPDRELLVSVLREQYDALGHTPEVDRQVEQLLDERTFTVVTAHQPSLFTGPLYYIFKIVSAIKLAQRINAEYPDYHVVPVFVSGGEDHDFEEVNHLNLFGKTVTWQSGETGSVGRMQTTSLEAVLTEVKEILGDGEHAQKIYALLEQTHTAHATYGRAALALVHELFGHYGLVVLNMDRPALKRAYAPYIARELFEQPSQALVEAAQQQLEAAGFSGQAHAREINFFYLQEQSRERIVLEGDTYRVLNTELSFSAEALRKEIKAHPERFSPNVVMRPLYQEAILPNLAYVGGGGELAYWLERKAQFAAFGLPFPMLVRRDSAVWIDKTAAKRMAKLDLTFTDLLQETEGLIKRFVKASSEEELSFKAEKKELARIFEQIAALTKPVDPTLVKTVKSEMAKTLNSVSQLEKRLMRAEKAKHDTAINQIRSVKEKLFPGNGLQERTDNFLAFYVRYGDTFIETLLEHFDPLDKRLVVISE